MDQQERDILQCRKLLLDFYSSELTTHSRLIVGFAVILFTILGITQKLQQPISNEQIFIACFGIFLAGFALWYLLMRHIAYGILANAATYADPSGEGKVFSRTSNAVNENALKKRILLVIPSCLFISTGTRISRLQKRFGVRGALALGALLCALLAIVTTYLFMILVGLA